MEKIFAEKSKLLAVILCLNKTGWFAAKGFVVLEIFQNPNTNLTDSDLNILKVFLKLLLFASVSESF